MARLVYTRIFLKTENANFLKYWMKLVTIIRVVFFLNLSLCFISIVLFSCNASRTATRLSNIGVLVKL